MLPNYFVCTLGEGVTLNKEPKPYRTISTFLAYQAEWHATTLAVGFPIPSQEEVKWSYRALSFSDVDRGTHVFAGRLSPYIDISHNAPRSVALLCHSSPEFLFTWLGLIRLGCSVLLIAPQCQATAIVHLCKACNVSLMIYDVAHTNKAKETVELVRAQDHAVFVAEPIPLGNEEDIFQVIQESPNPNTRNVYQDEAAIAYLHHTSGTSSGLPKPIPQTHRAAIGALPYLPETPSIATFTTTPLYHGGIADLFRSWTSDSLIWLFPSQDVPITARNICKCLDVATRACSARSDFPRIGYFSSVPYVLQMMGANIKGLKYLKTMNIVGVGGAALPRDVGDQLVLHDVNLISRYGSAECGFLLSSYRDFISDKEWRYLRDYNPPMLLSFEPQNETLSELVIKLGWPHMAKTNRVDGSFATADVFAKHPSISNAWLYHSRLDSQLTLITGKKFDPAPLEADIATSPHLEDVLIFGTGRPFPGALLMRSEQSRALSDQDLLAAVVPMMKKLNGNSQDHAKIPLHMLVPIPFQVENLEKSSKGTIIRRTAESRFEDIIKRAYHTRESQEDDMVADEELTPHLFNLIRSVVPGSDELTEDADLFAFRVDSITYIRLRSYLKRLIPKCQKDLPLSIIEDCGTVSGLTKFIMQLRHGEPNSKGEGEGQLMLDLVKQFSTFEPRASISHPTMNRYQSEADSSKSVVLTGATGALGAHILNQLRLNPKISTIYCLVRGANEHAALERLSKALSQRGLEDLSTPDPSNRKIQILQSQLSDPRLGLASSRYEHLCKKIDIIIHIAWTVNFRLKLRSFTDNLSSVQNLLSLALKSAQTQPPRFIYCSSTAAIINGTPDASGLLPEIISPDPIVASPLGYSQSKWVAERICATAHSQTRLHNRIVVIRVGQLSGDSSTGIWNTKEAWPMMLSTAGLIKCLPDLPYQFLDWLPVDIAARAFLDAVFDEISAENADYGEGKDSEKGKQKEKEDGNEIKDPDLPVYHVLNPHREPSWHTMLQWLQKRSHFDIVEPSEWTRRLDEKAQELDQPHVQIHNQNQNQNQHESHSALKLLGLWKETYGNGNGARGSNDIPAFSMLKTREKVPTLREAKPLGEKYIAKVWEWIVANVV